MLDATDQELMGRVKARGDREAFGALMSRHKRRAYLLALRLLGDHDEALDASQEAFVRCYHKAATYQEGDPGESPRGGAPFLPWLLRIVRNQCFNLTRARLRRRQVRDEQLLALLADPAADPASRLRQAELWRALLSLPARLREVLVLRHHEGLSYQEIADLLRVPSGTVATRLHQARLALEARHDLR